MAIVLRPIRSVIIRVIREFKHGVNGKPQTAKSTSEFLFFSCNP